MLLAGHETTAMALSFALWFLARHPEAAARVAREAADVMGTEAARSDDVAALGAANAAFKETLRLRPPVWLAYRQRGWNGQPEGTLIRLGGVPGIGTSRVVRSRSMRGIEASSPHVYGWEGWPKMSTAVPYSTGRPAYITRMSSA